jgi:hypothetical protein
VPGSDPDGDLTTVVRRLIESVTVYAKPGRGLIGVECKGCLAELTDLGGLTHETEIRLHPALATGRGAPPSDVRPGASSDEAGAFAGGRMR